jgi:hypothetical protein
MIWQILDDDSLHVHWFNSATGKFTANAMIFPAYLDEDAKLREVFTWTPTKAQEQQPVWGVVRRRQILGRSFELEQRDKNKFYLPSHARTTLATWLKASKTKA